MVRPLDILPTTFTRRKNMKPLFEKIPQRDSTREIIMNQFTKMIKEGELSIGDKIPPERNLAEQL